MTRIACILVPSFAVAVERQGDSSLAQRPVVVYDGSTVIDASPDAIGVHTGLPLRQAKALCPDAQFVKASHNRYRAVHEALINALESETLAVEPGNPGVAYADITGCDTHHDGEFNLAAALTQAVKNATGLIPSVGIAGGKFVAWVAAAVSPPGDAGLVPAGREAEFLWDKDITFLSFPLEMLQRLDRLALRTLGEIAALPQPAVEAQFRSAGRRLWELANGIDKEPIRSRRREKVLSERMNFEAPTVKSEVLVAASRQLAARLVRRLRGRTSRRMHVQLLADDQIVREWVDTFREPTSDEERVRFVLKMRLSLLELSQAIDTITVTLTGISREVGKQVKLFSSTNPNLNQLADAIRQLQARYRRPVVYQIREVNPCSRHPEERNVLVPYDA